MSPGGWPASQHRQLCTYGIQYFSCRYPNLWDPFTRSWGSWWWEHRCCCLDDPTLWSQPIVLLVGTINSKLSHWMALGGYGCQLRASLEGFLYLSWGCSQTQRRQPTPFVALTLPFPWAAKWWLSAVSAWLEPPPDLEVRTQSITTGMSR